MRLSAGIAIGTALVCAALSSASAQIAPGLTPPPVFQYVDDNGVNIVSETVMKTLGSISIGPGGPGSLSFTWSTDYTQTNAVGGYITQTQDPVSDHSIVTLMGSSETFTSPHGANSWTQDQGRPSTLAYNSGTGIFTYTAADGSVAVYSKNLVAGDPAAYAWGITSLTYPAGQVLNYYYTYVGTSNYDLSAVTSSLGYQLRLTHNPAGVLVGAVVFNMNTETCDPTAPSCTLTQTWPSLTLNTGTGVMVDSTNRSLTWINYTTQIQITYPSGRTLTYNGTRDPVTNVLKISSFTDGKGTWNYSGQPNPGGGTNFLFNPDNTAPRVISWVTSGVITQDIPSGSDPPTINYGYNSKNGLTSIKKTDGTVTSETDYGYDARGNLNSVRKISTTPGTPADLVESAIFPTTCTNPKSCNQPTSTTDARGNTTDYTYDTSSGQVATVTLPAPTAGAVRPQTRYSYTQNSAKYKNGSGTIISGPPAWLLTAVSECQTTASCAGAADEVKTSITPDVNQGLLPSSISKGNGTGTLTATTAMTYTGNGDVNTVDGPLSGTTDKTRNYYDTMRRPLGSIGPDPDGAGTMKRRAVRATYDNDGRPTTKDIGTAVGQGDNDLNTMTVLQQLVTGYDAQGRLATTKANAGGTTYSLVQTTYTNGGQLDCRTLRMNSAAFNSLPASACTLGTQGSFGPDRIGKYTHDALFRTTSITSGFGTSDAATDVTSTYDSLGRLSTIKDAENNLTTYEYDGMNRLQKARYPVPTKGANQSSTTDYEQLTYDPNGNVTSRRLREATSIGYTFDKLNRLTLKDLPGTEPDVTYGYDNLNRLTSASQTGNALSFSFDALSRNLTQGGPLGTVTSAWDLAGRRTQLTYPGTGLFVNYDYLLTDEVQKIRENGATTGIGVLATYAYDDRGKRTGVTYGNGTSTSYGYDLVSRLTSLTNDLAGTASDLTITMGNGTNPPPYNPASQITSVTRSNDAYAWTGHGSGTTASVANGLNQLSSIGGAAPTWDARGNMTLDPTTGKSYTYSSENLLKTATGGATLTYDPAMRLYQVTGASTTRFAYDVTHKIGEYDGSNILQKRYVFGPGVDEPIVQYDAAGNRTWMTADERGSILALANDGGTSTAIDKYDEYGKPQSGNSGRFQYDGQAWIAEIGAYDYKARVYLPHLGIFAQTDPIGYGDGLNWYAYVRNDPVNMVDPLGLDRCIHTTESYSYYDQGTTFNSGKSWYADYGVQCFADGSEAQDAANFAAQQQGLAASLVHLASQRLKHATLPADALRCKSGNVSFWAPPSFDWYYIFEAGREGGLSGAGDAVGHGGRFDFQRTTSPSGQPVYISAYTNASNFAVGLYLAGAGYDETSAGFISDAYASVNSKNFGDPKQAEFRNAGIDAANGNLVDCR